MQRATPRVRRGGEVGGTRSRVRSERRWWTRPINGMRSRERRKWRRHRLCRVQDGWDEVRRRWLRCVMRARGVCEGLMRVWGRRCARAWSRKRVQGVWWRGTSRRCNCASRRMKYSFVGRACRSRGAERSISGEGCSAVGRRCRPAGERCSGSGTCCRSTGTRCDSGVAGCSCRGRQCRCSGTRDSCCGARGSCCVKRCGSCGTHCSC